MTLLPEQLITLNRLAVSRCLFTTCRPAGSRVHSNKGTLISCIDLATTESHPVDMKLLQKSADHLARFKRHTCNGIIRGNGGRGEVSQCVITAAGVHAE